MSKTVFILGAGASAEAGVPLMNNFLDVAYDLWKFKRIKEDEEQHFENVFKGRSALQEAHSKSTINFNNLEDVFAAFEMAQTLGVFPGVKETDVIEHTNDLIESMKRMIAITIESTMILAPQNPGGDLVSIPFHEKQCVFWSPDPYLKFICLVREISQEINPAAVSIITFNYDLGCDYSLFQKHLYADYGLNDSSRSDRVKLLKLHGSLNWKRSKVDDSIEPVMAQHSSVIKYNGINDRCWLSIAHRFNTPDDDFFKTPFIVPPTWNKTGYYKPIERVWKQAVKELKEAENIIIIGYSFPASDGFFRYLYSLGTIGESILRRFWVFDPDGTGEVEKRFKALLGPGAIDRFKIFKVGFKEGINILRKEILEQEIKGIKI